jgi:hypothetical protein
MAQTRRLHGHPLSIPPDHQARLDPATPWTCPPTPTFQKGKPTRITYLRHLSGKTSIIMSKKTRLLRRRRIGLHLPLNRLAQGARDRDRPFPRFIVHITLLRAPQVSVHPLIRSPLILFPGLPKPTYPRSTGNGVASWAPVQVVQCAS